MTSARTWIPDYLKPFIRFIYYRQERAKVKREFGIRKIQDQNIKRYDLSTQKLIIFLISGADYDTGEDRVNGGIISIVSLCEETEKLKSIHRAEVILCTFPSEHLLLKHRKFKNHTNVFRFEQLKYFKEVEQVLVHIPDFSCNHFAELGGRGALNILLQKKLHLNILNQNVRLMPLPEQINDLRKYGSDVTATTAHQQYCTLYFRQYYGVPLHNFSVWISPEKYFFRPYAEKENLLVVSPDRHPMKDKVLAKLKLIKGLSVLVIQGFSYEQYKELISKAKWSLTFGEGLDGYFIEPIFSGSISFAIYNEDFFTPDFAEMQTVYPSFEGLMESLVNDIVRLDNSTTFEKYQKNQYDLCAKHYNQEVYRQNISEFYRGNYTFK